MPTFLPSMKCSKLAITRANQARNFLLGANDITSCRECLRRFFRHRTVHGNFVLANTPDSINDEPRGIVRHQKRYAASRTSTVICLPKTPSAAWIFSALVACCGSIILRTTRSCTPSRRAIRRANLSSNNTTSGSPSGPLQQLFAFPRHQDVHRSPRPLPAIPLAESICGYKVEK